MPGPMCYMSSTNVPGPCYKAVVISSNIFLAVQKLLHSGDTPHCINGYFHVHFPSSSTVRINFPDMPKDLYYR